ncbi:MAG: hypothetical protein A3F67_07075 [Verrucomicrobia bacterium RIFCSPHIGHO2_12_FULL_41_10]|nr:MAG: hypothetical protein A3F67_07075 [Verrucomicrobia bacterium RIFCSPHIGHO2_12_FULL_41_10]
MPNRKITKLTDTLIATIQDGGFTVYDVAEDKKICSFSFADNIINVVALDDESVAVLVNDSYRYSYVCICNIKTSDKKFIQFGIKAWQQRPLLKPFARCMQPQKRKGRVPGIGLEQRILDIAAYDATHVLEVGRMISEGALKRERPTYTYIALYDVENDECVLEQVAGSIYSQIIVLEESKLFALINESGGIDLWDAEKKAIKCNVPGHPRHFVTSAFLLPKTGDLMSFSTDATARVWDIASTSNNKNRFKYALKLPFNATDRVPSTQFPSSQLHINPRGFVLQTHKIGCVINQTMYVWDAISGEELFKESGWASHPTQVCYLVTPDGRFYSVAASGSLVLRELPAKIFSIKPGEPPQPPKQIPEINQFINLALRMITNDQWETAIDTFTRAEHLLSEIVPFKFHLHALPYFLFLLRVLSIFKSGHQNEAVAVYFEKVGIIRYLESKQVIPFFLRNYFDRFKYYYRWLEIDESVLDDSLLLKIRKSLWPEFRNALFKYSREYFEHHRNPDMLIPSYLQFALAAKDAYSKEWTSASSQLGTCPKSDDATVILETGQRLALVDFGWELVTTAAEMGCKGYFAKAYINRRKQLILIAHKGTNFVDHRDRKADIRLTGQEKFKYLDIAEMFFNFVKQHPRLTEIEKQYHFLMTGHSLGGAIAEYLGTIYNLPTVTIDNPGVREILAKEHSNLDFKSAPVTNIVSRPNHINQANDHIGRMLCIPERQFKDNRFMSRTASSYWLRFLSVIAINRLVGYFSEFTTEMFGVKYTSSIPALIDGATSLRLMRDFEDHFVTRFIDYFENEYPKRLHDALCVVQKWPIGLDDESRPIILNYRRCCIPLTYFTKQMTLVFSHAKLIAQRDDFPDGYEQLFHTLRAIRVCDAFGAVSENGDHVFTNGIDADTFRMQIWPYFVLPQHRRLQDYLKKVVNECVVNLQSETEGAAQTERISFRDTQSASQQTASWYNFFKSTAQAVQEHPIATVAVAAAFVAMATLNKR